MRGPNYRLRAALRLLGRRAAALAAALAVLTGLVLLRRQADRLLRQYAAVWCGDVAARSVNAAIEAGLDGAAEVSTLLTDGQGRLTGVQIDSVAASRLKAAVALAISENLRALEGAETAVPLGTLLGGRLLLGRGPAIRVRLMPVGSARVEIVSRFVEAGINQTAHQTVLRADLTVTVLLPGAAVYQAVSQEALLSETVIVGEVPNLYAGLD